MREEEIREFIDFSVDAYLDGFNAAIATLTGCKDIMNKETLIKKFENEIRKRGNHERV